MEKIQAKILPWFMLSTLVAFGLMSMTLAKEKTEAKKQDTISVTYKCTKGGCAGRSAFECCPGDQTRMQKALMKIKGVTNVILNRETSQVTLEYQKGKLNEKALTKAMRKYGLVQ